MPEKQRYWFVFSIFLILIFAGCISQNSSGDIGDGVDDLPENTTANDSGTIIINAVTVPPGQAGSFTYTGVPTGTLTIESPLVVSDLDPGTYTTTQI
ncbi:MAG: hypothetical protein GWN00_23195, partial [Aliifodinibius sp.]|nr:hypothetical protein [candidate division Zixibacteria bacterium]NIT59021.1 hypothetical protein [Fodinibius sp.]NIV13843.1 hypothetical protein [Fodinibius sp.]NIY27604.1 hypothetical protein [Fodinibius sp.]